MRQKPHHPILEKAFTALAGACPAVSRRYACHRQTPSSMNRNVAKYVYLKSMVRSIPYQQFIYGLSLCPGDLAFGAAARLPRRPGIASVFHFCISPSKRHSLEVCEHPRRCAGP
ncbi:hypothetical protein CCC_03219 [Paramagnetospirillum magnetotacticum MS-1]|uniref:Uncharacterized protein n=1 Tax=Paramagnetospirillum magnetotacticum MS-1 TaxID=272627 RepID=A0A0C2V6E8_PARME|nr:hypothetical protein CCC_03219 [Paramagnetospirillum magnetotacticum MS-1]